ncbi:MAG: hypothetical protein E5X09_17820, partial [Mesorhizobium sp.]
MDQHERPTIGQRQTGGMEHVLPAGIERGIQHHYQQRPFDLAVGMNADFGRTLVGTDRGRLEAGKDQMDHVAGVDDAAMAVQRHFAVEGELPFRVFGQRRRFEDIDAKAGFDRFIDAQCAEHQIEARPELGALCRYA